MRKNIFIIYIIKRYKDCILRPALSQGKNNLLCFCPTPQLIKKSLHLIRQNIADGRETKLPSPKD